LFFDQSLKLENVWDRKTRTGQTTDHTQQAPKLPRDTLARIKRRPADRAPSREQCHQPQGYSLVQNRTTRRRMETFCFCRPLLWCSCSRRRALQPGISSSGVCSVWSVDLTERAGNTGFTGFSVMLERSHMTTDHTQQAPKFPRDTLARIKRRPADRAPSREQCHQPQGYSLVQKRMTRRRMETFCFCRFLLWCSCSRRRRPQPGISSSGACSVWSFGSGISVVGFLSYIHVLTHLTSSISVRVRHSRLP